MTEKFELYKCNICGNLIQVLFSGDGELVCCGQPMEHLIPHKEEHNELAEKHTPEMEMIEGKKYVTLKHHPMEKEHYIQFIEVYKKDKSCLHIKYFKPGEKAELDISCLDENIKAQELCNIHGLWEGRE